MCQLVGHPQRAQHVGWLQACRSTCRTGGYSQIFQRHNQRFAFNIVEANVENVRCTLLEIAVKIHFFHIFHAVPQTVTQTAQARHLGFHLFFSDTVSFTHADDLVHRQRTGTHTALVTAAVHLRFNTNTRFTTHVQRTDTFRTIDFVAGEGHQINFQLAQIDRQFAHALGRINVIDDAARTAHFADSRDILHHADFVIHVHDGHEDSVVTHCRFKFFQVDNAVTLRGEVGDFKPFALQLTTGVQHGFVFGFAGDDVLAFFLIKVGCTFNRQVIGFSRTGSKDDFTRVSAHEVSNLVTGDIYRLFSLPAETV